MQSQSGSRVTLRQVIENTVKPGKRLEVLLGHPLVELSLEEVLSRREAILEDVRLLPHIGEGTVSAIDEALRHHFGLTPAERKLDAATPVKVARADNARRSHDATHRVRSSRPLRSQTDALDLTRSDVHPFWLWVQSGVSSAYYLPHTLPNILMTPALWRVENRQSDKVLKYLPSTDEVLEVLACANKNIDFVIDTDVWNDFTTGSGQYAFLSKSEMLEQATVFDRLQRDSDGRVSFSIASHEENGLSKCLVSKGGFLSTYVFGGYYVTHNETLISKAFQDIQAAKPQKISQPSLGRSVSMGQVIQFSRSRHR
ncbi:hypothetical protein [Roseicyclus sp.]